MDFLSLHRAPFSRPQPICRRGEARFNSSSGISCSVMLTCWRRALTLLALLLCGFDLSGSEHRSADRDGELRVPRFLGFVAAYAQIVSPGPLARPHASVEGILNCTRCHTLGQKEIEETKCFGCHALIDGRVAEGRGYHAQTSVRSQGCGECHKDHAGLDFQMIEWKGGREAFDHALAEYPLEGKHREVRCESCHRPELIADTAVHRVLAEHPTKKTYLGLDRNCVSCHFDEHRGQFSESCDRCHDLTAFRPAPLFDHDQTIYPLVGAHRETACDRCHARQVDNSRAAVLGPTASDYAVYKRLSFDDCRDCHDDPHLGRLGERCLECHLDGTWKVAAENGRESRIDHDRTRYPLRGRHIGVACQRCHPRNSRGLLVSQDLPFSRCDDCHRDAHPDQFSSSRDQDCASCHEVTGFTPATFGAEEHARSPYPLEGAHLAVPCSRCHADQPGAEAERQTFRSIPDQPPHARRLATQQFSFGEYPLASCETCHGDPHAGQFLKGGTAPACADCHSLGSFSELAFDHASVYPLTGKHAHARCSGCHPRDAALGGARPSVLPWLQHVQHSAEIAPVRYSGISQTCRVCHRDPHLGQFKPSPIGDCERCHDTESFAIASTYDHGTTRFPLAGAHEMLHCDRCHPSTEILPGSAAARYVAVPQLCGDCHEDPHEGSFRSNRGQSNCAGCHNETSWHQVTFDHALTGFELGAEHQLVACAACHGAEAAPRECIQCHNDVHGAFLGPNCGECHNGTAGFSRVALKRVHEQTRLPLIGRHATVPCASCHVDRLDLKFMSLDPQCARCHEDDYQAAGTRAGMDHVLWGFDRACDHCHDAYRWDRATYLQHEKCFPIARGEHSGITCLRCHTSLDPMVTETCATFTADCMQCHGCANMSDEHRQVEGFECADRKCWECHPQGRK